MSKLSSLAAKHGLTPKQEEKKPGKKSLASIPAPKAVINSVDDYLLAEADKSDAEARLAVAQDVIRDFALNHAVKIHEMDNFQLEASQGSVNVVFKDQYSLKDKDLLVSELKKFNIDPAKHIKEETSLNFAFDKMTEKEQNALFAFLKKDLGQGRFAEIVTESTKTTIKGLKDEIARVAKNRSDLESLKQASGMYNPTIAKRKD